jgi:hypothetical protein
VYEQDEPFSSYYAKEMAWCASSQLRSFGDCRWRFYYGVLPRCSLCLAHCSTPSERSASAQLAYLEALAATDGLVNRRASLD